MLPYATSRLGDEIPVLRFRTRFDEIDEELVGRLGPDGKLRLSHRADGRVVALLDLTGGWPIGPYLEQVAPFPGLIKSAVTDGWETYEGILHVDDQRALRGPLLLLEADGDVDVYTDRPPHEENATATRVVTRDDIRGGWYVDFHDWITARRPTRVVALRRPLDTL